MKTILFIVGGLALLGIAAVAGFLRRNEVTIPVAGDAGHGEAPLQ